MIRALFFTVFFVALAIGYSSCENNKGNETPQYYYYPKKNVYYDVGKHSFIYSLDGAKTWQSFASTDTNIQSLGDRISLYEDSLILDIDNIRHRKLYGGTLLRIVNNETNTVAIGKEVAERKEIKKEKTPIADSASEEKPKKGIGKFFDKIFGKHKDKK